MRGKDERAEEMYAKLRELSLAIDDAERELQKLRDERINLTFKLRRLRGFS